MSAKSEPRGIREEIRRVLLQIWDPIGVKHVAQAQDEYDSYIGDIHDLLIAGAANEVIEAHLLGIVTDRMGLPASVEDMSETVRALRQIALPKTSLATGH